MTSLTALSPIDGRYANKVDDLRNIFSEFGLMRFRILVEIRWLQCFAATKEINEVPALSEHAFNLLNNIYDNFSVDDARRIKNIESTTNHDVKAIEYFIKEKIGSNEELANISEFIHFACTSEDINNLSYSLMLQTARQQCLLPYMDEIISVLTAFANEYAAIPLLSRTHGQAATPSTVGKEFANFVARLTRQRENFKDIKINGKINGAVGNYNAHVSAYPDVDWLALSQQFVENFNLHWNAYTTQIEPHDFIAEFSHSLIRFNNILKDLARDMWGYISLDYFSLKLVSHEVGSSTMPHKVNPIDFENAEGNLGVANALFDFFANQLPLSRAQRDLVDSTILRNLGVAVAHSLIAYQSLLKGLNKLAINPAKLVDDLNQHWEVLAEAIQTVMRRYGVANPYEQLKSLTRGKKITKDSLKELITQLEIPEDAKSHLLNLTPETYIGLARELAEKI